MSVLSEIRQRFRPVLSELTDDVDAALAMIRPAQDARFGDFQANCAMPLAGRLKQPPRSIAQSIVDNVSLDDLCRSVEIAGPGFINLTLRDDWLTQSLQQLVTDDRLGVTSHTPRRIVVDYSSPNVAKPMHVGHLRSSVIGSALCRILTFAGHQVISDNHIGDWGTQFGMIIFGYRHFVDAEAYQRDPVTELARLYRLVNQLCDYHEALGCVEELTERVNRTREELTEAEQAAGEDRKAKKALRKQRNALADLEAELHSMQSRIDAVADDVELKRLADAHPDIAREARLETARLHAGDAENRRLWDEFLPACLDALQRVYDKLGIAFDYTLGESFYQPMLADVVAELKASGLATDSDGAVCVFIEDSAAPFIVQKSDGAFTYATTDLATIRYRVNEFNAEVMLYVVDTRQSGHFQLLFETARRWGYSGVDFHHVNFGTVLGEDRRPFKTRSGDTVGLESLLDEAVSRAHEIVVRNDPDNRLDPETRQRVAQAVGIGGIKYADLRHSRESDYVFNWDKMLAKTGDTAAYIQYANARIHGIFRKAELDRSALRADVSDLQISEPSERALALQLLSFGDVIDAIALEYRPHLLTQFLFETADRFSTFYNECPVAKEPDASRRRSRLLLSDLTGRMLTAGLDLLGIEAPDVM